jgi:Transglycosylase SLT domain
MGRLLRRGGEPGSPAIRGRAVLAALGAAVALGAVAIDLFALTASHDPARATGSSAPRRTAHSVPVSASARPTEAASVGTSGRPATVSSIRQIILPDLLIVAPGGLADGQIAQLRALTGVRNMITFDGAQLTAGGRQVSVIGVNPATFRSWVPLQTAADQPFWTDLAQGKFVAQDTSADSLGLIPGGSYQLTGASAQVIKFGTSAPLGMTGVDLLVNQALSQKLGLVRQVAGLISAPGVSIATLQARVGQILGKSGQMEVLRATPAPAPSPSAAPAGTRPTSYLELFKESAAQYCPGLSWTVLAAIGQIESGDGRNMGPSSAGALGPMQFLPSTWQAWGIDAFGQTGSPDIMNPFDAVPSAARMLCADGAARGGTALYNAIFDYNHADWYVNEVLALAAQYAAEYP